MTAIRNMLIIIATLFVAAPALAQSDPHHPANAAPKMPAQSMPGGQPGMMDTGEDGDTSSDRMAMGMMGGRMMEMMAVHTDGWLAFLKTELKITDAQSAQWNAFADAVRVNAKGMKDMRASMMEQRSRSAALPDRLGLHEQMLSAHLDALRRLKAAAEPLYASLSEEQKKAADEVISSSGMMAGMM